MQAENCGDLLRKREEKRNLAEEKCLAKGVAVSIIVPIYNVEKYLAECLDSILGQTFRDMEIILVDDGASDASGQMADDYAARDKRVIVIHKENRGISSARNAGLKIARGEYVYFCDSDDYISSDAIETLYKTALVNNLDMLLFNGDSFLDKDDIGNKELKSMFGRYKRYYDRKLSTGGVKEGTALFAEMNINHEYRPSVCLQFIKRAYCLENHLCFYEGIVYEDNLYSFKALLLAQRVMFLHKKLFHRRVRASSTMTSREGLRNFKGYFVVYCEAVCFLSRYKFDGYILKEAEKVIHTGCKGNALRIWDQLSEKEKVGFRDQLPMLQRIMFDEMTGNGRCCEELYDIRHSYSFRIGRILTWFPRKIRGGIRCIRQHGVGYTARRVLEHLGIDMGTPDFRRSK